MRNIPGPLFVAGFNTRPVVEALVTAGFTPVPLDYFGDVDLQAIAPGGFHYLRDGNPPGREGFSSWVIATLAAIARRPWEGRPLPGGKPVLLPCSGFDDDHAAWDAFHETCKVLGNDPAAVRAARDPGAVRSVIEPLGAGIDVLPSPRWRVVDGPSLDALALEVARDPGFPLVIKRIPGGGGAGIVSIDDAAGLDSWVRATRSALASGDAGALDCIVQPRVADPGAINASVLALNDRVACTTVQLIGDPAVNAPVPFSYCGNVVPATSVDPGLDWLGPACEVLVRALHDDLGLRGLYGIDLVVTRDRAFFMEINPRVPGSVEPAMLSLGRNLVADHVASFLDGPGPRDDAFHPAFQGTKRVLFAREAFTMPDIGGLPLLGMIKDVSPPGTRIRAGEPVLTYLLRGSLEDPGRNAHLAALEIEAVQRALHGDEPT